MKTFKFGVGKVITRGREAFDNFPASIFSGLLILLIAIIRIEMDYEIERPYNFFFDSFQIAFVFGGVFSMVLVSLRQVGKLNKPKLLTNLFGIFGALLVFVALYFFGFDYNEEGYRYLKDIASARVTVLIFLSVILFIISISDHENIKTFPNAFFISHKAFIISMIYGLVLLIGVYGVLGAFQSLVYTRMSSKLYQYFGAIIGFLTYTIFLGYFPIFNKDEEKVLNETKEKSSFIRVLFDYILIPIIIALTLVLFTWSARVLIGGIDVSFTQLSSITSSYVLVGIWLHIMVSDHNTSIANFYKKAYPFSAILILIFEARALIVQLNKTGLQTREYFFILLWVFAGISVILLLVNSKKYYKKIALLAGLISVIAILPIIGYHKLPLNLQINRLERVLIREELLVDNNIITRDKEIDEESRISITNAVEFIGYSRDGDKPTWFKEDLNNDLVFEKTFGFKKVYSYDDYDGPYNYYSTNLTLGTQIIDVSNYDLAIKIGLNKKDSSTSLFKLNGKDYELTYKTIEKGLPSISLKSQGIIIFEGDLSEFLEGLEEKYPPNDYKDLELDFRDMTYEIRTGEINLSFVFNSINIYNDNLEGRKDYYLDINTIYIR